MDSVEHKVNLITRRLIEVNGEENVQRILATGGTPRCFWGKILSPG